MRSLTKKSGAPHNPEAPKLRSSERVLYTPIMTIDTHVLVLQGGSFDVDESVRLVPAPDIHRPYSEPLEVS